MSDHSNPLIAPAKSCSRALSLLTTLMGGAALAGWLLHIPWLTCAASGAPTLAPDAAACFVLAGLALPALQAGHARFVHVAASVTGLTGLLTFVEYVFALDPGIGRLLIEILPEAAQAEFPGRMAPASALNFLLAGIGLLILALRRGDGAPAAQGLAGLVFLSGLFSLIGHLYGAQALRAFAPYQSMSVYATVAFLSLSSALLLAFPETGFMGALTSSRWGGAMARRLLPIIASVTVLLGWLRLEGQRAGLYGTEAGLALFALANIAVLGVMIFRSARRLNQLDRQQAATHAALLKKDAQLAKAQELAHVGYWEWEIASNVLGWSDEIYRIFGYAPGSFVPSFEMAFAHTHPEDREALRRDIDRALRTVKPYDNEHRIFRTDGTERIVHCHGHVIVDKDAEAVRMFGTVQDVTERVRSEEALRRSDARFRWLFDCDMIGIGFWKTTGEIADANQSLLRLLGYAREDIESGRLNWRDLTPPKYRHLDDKALREITERGVITPFEKEYIHKSGRKIPVLIGAAADSNSPDQGVFFVLDLSARKEAEDRAHRMAMMAMMADERERKILARDLHDGLGQMLHVAKIKLDAITDSKCAEHSQLRVLDELISGASRRVRSLTAQLAPPVLEIFGLMPALDWLAEEMERTYGLAVEIDDDGGVKPINPVQASILFRAVRELLINVAKHAGVRQARTLVRSGNSGLTLTVEDHGVGMASLADILRSREGYGLASVMDRIRYLGGTLEICRPAAGGSAVTLRMPFAPLIDGAPQSL